ncbi:MAG: YeeE/YedE family protein, partial [Bdellovibrionales bacterium]|nr:YeeE/YedE family protein [Bdellovibrionales bacterium]
MIASSFFGLLTGMLFGVALYKVGAVRYSRVVGMITLRDCKVMKFAFTAIAFTSMVYGLAAIMGVASSWNLVPRVMPFTGWSHLIGGVIFGTTMAVTGYCPGACMARFGHAAGIHRFAPISAIIGLFVGILIYSVIKMPLIDAGIIMARPQAISLYGLMG